MLPADCPVGTEYTTVLSLSGVHPRSWVKGAHLEILSLQKDPESFLTICGEKKCDDNKILGSRVPTLGDWIKQVFGKWKFSKLTSY